MLETVDTETHFHNKGNNNYYANILASKFTSFVNKNILTLIGTDTKILVK